MAGGAVQGVRGRGEREVGEDLEYPFFVALEPHVREFGDGNDAEALSELQASV